MLNLNYEVIKEYLREHSFPVVVGMLVRGKIEIFISEIVSGGRFFKAT